MADRRPLAGVRVAVTRSGAGGEELGAVLAERGAEPILLPLTRIAAPLDVEPLRDASARLGSFDWLVFTSANAVRALAGQADEPRGVPAALRIAAVGPATAAAVETAFGRSADVVPRVHRGAALPAAMAAHQGLRGARILWPRAELARDALADDLVARGAIVEAPVAYRTVGDLEAAQELVSRVETHEVDVITFAAPSAVESFAAARGRQGQSLVAVIGPVTAEAARQAGMRVDVVPSVQTTPALVDAIEARLAGHGRPG